VGGLAEQQRVAGLRHIPDWQTVGMGSGHPVDGKPENRTWRGAAPLSQHPRTARAPLAGTLDAAPGGGMVIAQVVTAGPVHSVAAV
jgi:hypothetical protein